MTLSDELISQFAKITNDTQSDTTDTTVYGTTVEYNGRLYARIDGSDRLTPIETTADIRPGDRVTITVKNHTATVTGNVTSPSARVDDVKDLDEKVEEFYSIVADKVTVEQLDAEIARIDNLEADTVVIRGDLTAYEGRIDELESDNIVVNEKLTATEAEIDNLQANKLDAEIADIKYATITDLEATDATIHNLQADYGEFVDLTTEDLKAANASIANLEATKLDAETADIKYANIDFSNIGQAAMEYFYAQSGLIKDVIVGDGTITGELVGVTIRGDLIEGNTIVADKLVVKGEDGLYYKLNTDGVTTEAEQTEYNSLNGEVITAKSITATKIAVDDLVAFDATIGGFNITDTSIYSGVKSSATNTTRGIYLDKEGQMAIGDGNNYIRYFKDQNGEYKLEISMGGSSGGDINDRIDQVVEELDTLKDEITSNLRIESSRGTVFKNDSIATVLSAVIYHGSQRITDMASLKAAFGNSAYLQWKWQRLDDDSYGVIVATDKRFSNDGFTFTLSPDDVDTKITFMCELII